MQLLGTFKYCKICESIEKNGEDCKGSALVSHKDILYIKKRVRSRSSGRAAGYQVRRPKFESQSGASQRFIAPLCPAMANYLIMPYAKNNQDPTPGSPTPKQEVLHTFLHNLFSQSGGAKLHPRPSCGIVRAGIASAQQCDLQQASTPVVGLKPTTEGSMQTSGWISYPSCHYFHAVPKFQNHNLASFLRLPSNSA
ncbi:hypothetical protein PoB_004724400 [Plakobranchus ocellatus]|uniref:Uncharacterized protein n=1 Tax=Plakobranchus ocellatus TaxID=259542 RepID=A0AAV4BPG1_9GAST|nr:hypothetical protein PoB_004724400 [Plakobranchus ocellatus]